MIPQSTYLSAHTHSHSERNVSTETRVDRRPHHFVPCQNSLDHTVPYAKAEHLPTTQNTPPLPYFLPPNHTKRTPVPLISAPVPRTCSGRADLFRPPVPCRKAVPCPQAAHPPPCSASTPHWMSTQGPSRTPPLCSCTSCAAQPAPHGT